MHPLTLILANTTEAGWGCPCGRRVPASWPRCAGCGRHRVDVEREALEALRRAG